MKHFFTKKTFKTFLFGLLLFFSEGIIAQTITTNTIVGTSFCAGESLNVSYSIIGSFNSPNTFTAQLSDVNGTFNSPINIGQVSSITSGTIPVVLPLNTISGFIYKVRVVANNPSIIGSDNGANLNINPLPAVNAGVDQTVCSSSTVTMSASVNSVAPFITWSSSGTGFFNNVTVLNAVYNPSSADISNGSVILTISTNDPIGPCLAVNDNMTVNFSNAPTVSAGLNQSVCVRTNSINLTGTIGGSATSATWSTSGTGSFLNSASLNTNYIPSAADKLAGNVILSLTTNDPIGPCNATVSSLTITFTPVATVNAGIDETICENDNITLTGATSAVGGTRTWSTLGSGTFNNASQLFPTYFPSVVDKNAGSVKLILTINNINNLCENGSDTMTLNINNQATVFAGNDIRICSSSNGNIPLSGNFGGSASFINWFAFGSGRIDLINDPNTFYIPGPNDKIQGSVMITLTTNDPLGPCGPVVDTLIITFDSVATVNAGPDQTICENGSANLNPSLSGAANSGTWTSSFDPSFVSSNPKAIFTPNAEDIARGNTRLTFTTNDPNGACPAAKDSINITFNSLPTVFAGFDQNVCSLTPSISISGSFDSPATSASWTTSGTGTFANRFNVSTTYIPSAADRNSGSVTLTLTTNDPAGPCGPVSDFSIITLRPVATVNAGNDTTFCETSTIVLRGTRSVTAGNITWRSSGTGTFIRGASLTPTYVPSSADITNGFVTITLTNFNPNDECFNATDSMILSLSRAATVNAGGNLIVCSNVNRVPLNGSFGGAAASVNWITLGTGTFENSSIPITAYIPSVADKANGFVRLVLRSNDPIGPCDAKSDTIQITINLLATVNAGADQTICSNDNITLLGSSTATSGNRVWSTTGTGTFNNNSILFPTYFPSNLDKQIGSIKLILNNINLNDACANASDTMVLTINNEVTVNAGVQISSCLSSSSVQLNGTIGGSATSGAWTTSGSGTFDNANSLSANYSPSIADKNNGFVRLALTTNDPLGPCVSKTDSLTVFFDPIATVNTGIDQIICANTSASVSAIVGGSASFGVWTSSSNSNYIGFNSTNIYTPTTTDINNGFVTLTFTTNDPSGPCGVAKDSVQITINQQASVNAGIDQIECTITPIVNIFGSIGGSASSALWSTLGSGTFGNASDLNTNYTPSITDKNNGFVRLVLTSNNPLGPCEQVSDTMQITFNQLASIDAGPDQTICSNDNITFSGTTNASSGIINWFSNGDGIFNNSNTLFPTYFPGVNDKLNGNVIITFSNSDINDVCVNVADNLILNINQEVIVSAGSSLNVCEKEIDIKLKGSIGGSATSATWSSSGTGTFNNANLLNAIYTPSIADKLKGSVLFLLTSNDPIGPCIAKTGLVTITFDPVAKVDAGINQNICSDENAIISAKLEGAATFGSWTSSTNSSFISFNTNTTYIPSLNELTNGFAILTFTTNDPFGQCSSEKDSIQINFNQAASVDAGSDQSVCVSEPTINLSGLIGGSASSSTWRSLGSGTFVNATNLNTAYIPSAVDKSNGFVKLILSTDDPVGPCDLKTDTLQITFNPLAIVNAGLDKTICSNDNITLSGASSTNNGNRVWSTTGTGSFNNNSILFPTYFPSNADKLLGNIKIILNNISSTDLCANATDTMELTINSETTVSAGNTIAICASSNSIQLNGTIGGLATSGTWTTNGSGTFDNVNSLNANYFPSIADKNNGFVRLALTTNDPLGPCVSKTDSLTINFDPIATVNVGIDQTICSNTSAIISAVIGGSASFGVWTSSSNTSYSNFNSTTNYTPTTAEINNGFVVLTFTTNDPWGPCDAAKDSIQITINQQAIVSAGTDQTVCVITPSVNLSGSIGGSATSATWSSLGSGTFGNTSILNTTYTPSNTDKANGFVRLVLTTDNPTGPCEQNTDTVQITFNQLATINAGANLTICSNNNVTLAGSSSATSGNRDWLTTGTGFFSNSSILFPTYFPSPADILAGSVELILINSSFTDVCLNVSDTMTLFFNQEATVDAGNNINVCINTININLNGTVGGSATSATWSTNGTGTFNNVNSVNAIYTPSLADKSNGFVRLALTTNDPVGPCNANRDSVTITFDAIATVDAGSDQVLCSNSTTTISATIGGSASFGTWTSENTSTYISFNTTTNYIPNITDLSFGSVKLYFTTNDPAGACPAVKDSLVLSFNQSVYVFAGFDFSVCNSSSTFNLNGSIGGSASSSYWRTLGSGSFNDTNLLNATYFPSLADKSNGVVLLVLTTNDPSGPCGLAIDTVVVSFNSLAIADVGPDLTICDKDNISLNATINVSTGSRTWTSSGSGFFNNNSLLTPTYFPSNSDKSAGNVLIIFKNFNISDACNNVSDTLVLNINPSPIVNGGLNKNVCINDTFISLFGSINGGASSAYWKTMGSGTFNDTNSLTANYTPSLNDKITGFVNLVLVSNDPIGPCNFITDTMKINFTPLPLINAGLDQEICEGGSVLLNGSYNNLISVGKWTSNTDKFFNSFDSITIYTPNITDITNGFAILNYKAINVSGNCALAEDSVLITINKIPTANAGIDQVLCKNVSAISLSGSIGGGASAPLWVAINGLGTFDDPTAFNTIYRPSAGDLLNDSIVFTLTTDDPNGSCFAAFDDIVVKFKDSTVRFTSQILFQSCDSAIVEFTNNTSGSGNTYTWDFGDNTFSNDTNAIHTYYRTGLFDVKLKLNALNGCEDSLTLPININGLKPKANFSINNLNQCKFGSNYIYNNTSVIPSNLWIVASLWDYGDNTNTTATFPNAKKYSASGSYNVKLIIIASNGCIDSVTKTINVLPGPQKPTITVLPGLVLSTNDGVSHQWFLNGNIITGATNKTYNTSSYGYYKVRVDSANGCSEISDDFEFKFTAVKERNLSNSSLVIYPNPSNGIFKIESDLTNLDFIVYDINGKEIITGKKTLKTQLLDLNEFNSGVYLIKLFNNEALFIKRIIKN